MKNREAKVISWKKIMKSVGGHGYLVHKKYMITPIHVGVMATEGFLVRFKFRGYFLPRVHSRGTPLD